MKKVVLASLTMMTFVALLSCGERGGTAEQASEVEDSAAVVAAEPMAAPGEEAALVEEGEGLLARVMVTDGEARVVALMKVPGGRIAHAVLSERDGRLVYAYDLVLEGQPGITAVVVDALTAEVVSSEPKSE